MKRGDLVLCGAALLAGGVAAVTTQGRDFVAPSPLVLAGSLVAVAACCLAWGKLAPLAAIAGSIVAGLAAGHVVVLVSGMPGVHDILHLWGIWAYGRCVSTGAPYPTWIPYLGAGLPLFEFYGPVNFLLALPGIVAGLSPVGAWKCEMLVSHGLASVSMLLAARLLGATWRGALLAAAALAFAPWRLAVFDYRGALGEANAFVFLPLVAAGTLRCWSNPGRTPAVVLVLSAAGLVLTHLVSLFTLLVALVPVIAVIEMARSRPAGPARSRRLGSLGLAWLAVAGVTAWFWVPVLLESRYTAIEETTRDNPFYLYAEQGVRPPALLERRAWDQLRVSIPETARRERGLDGAEMPFYAGAVLVLLAATSPFWSGRRETWAPAASLVLCLVLSTSPAAHLLARVPGFETLRFPWRFLSPASVLAALSLGVASDAWRKVALPLVLLAALWLDAVPYTGAADRIPAYSGAVHWYVYDPRDPHWETSRRPVPVAIPPDGRLVRVRNLELPPSDYRAGVESFFPGYYEWLTPAVYREHWRSSDPARLAEAGVSLAFRSDSPEPQQIAARPYASLEGKGLDARCAPGRVAVEVTVPGGGGRLVVLEQRFPGWEVRVDGVPAALAEGTTFLEASLPAGPHSVVFEYTQATWPRRAGLLVSLATLGVGLAVGLESAFRRKR